MAKFIVSEKVLVERSYTVDADSKEDAINRAADGEVPFDSEEEIGTTQWDAEIQSAGAPPYDAATATGMYDMYD